MMNIISLNLHHRILSIPFECHALLGVVGVDVVNGRDVTVVEENSPPA